MTHIRDLSIGEHELIGDIIGDSFADDPVNLWIFSKQTGMTAYYTSVARKLYLQRGYGHVMDDASGGSLWLPPGVNKNISLFRSLDVGASMIRHGGLKSIPRGLAADTALARHKPKEPHFYLFAIGARAGRQGKGIGGKLMAAGLERVDAAGMPAYLESSKEKNVPFYRRFGFEVIEKVVPTKAGPPLWLMWRVGKTQDTL